MIHRSQGRSACRARTRARIALVSLAMLARHARSSCSSSRHPCRGRKGRAPRRAVRHSRATALSAPRPTRSPTGPCTIAATTARASRRSRRSPRPTSSTLAPACTFPLGVKANMQSGLVAVNGTLYFTTATDTYAIDAATCALRWRHHYDYDPKPPFDPNKVNRGVTYLADPIPARGSSAARTMGA